MSHENNKTHVYLKDRNFINSGYGRHSKQSSLCDLATDTACNVIGSKGNKGNSNCNEFEIKNDLGIAVNYVRIKALEERIRKDIKSDKTSLHRAITPVLILARFFAMLPVQGIQGQNTSYLVFNWISWPVIYVFIVLSTCLLLSLLSLLKIYHIGLTYYSTGEIVFYGSSVVVYLIFIHLARKWPIIMAKWELMEREMRQFKYLPNTALKIKVLTSVVMSLALVEYVVFVLTGILKTIPCLTDELDIFRVYFFLTFHQVFTVIPYSIVIALPLGVFNLILTFAWNFMDLFIMILAIALSDRFKQINQRLAYVKGQVLPSSYWRKSRETYNFLASLTQDFDEFLSPVILLSFAHNLYFICLQLLKSLKPMHSAWEVLCFLFLFTYLVARTCAVTLYAASINGESKKPKSVLFSVPTESYGVEVARFITQVTANELALTGYNFFSVTRTFMLTVAGTIVTYEIVLIQFNNVASDVNNQNNTLDYCS